MHETTFATLVDEAIEKLGPIRRMILKRQMKSETYRQTLYDNLAAKCCDELDEETVAQFYSKFDDNGIDESFDAHAALAIDPERLSKLLDLIIKYLPQILAIIFQLFPK